MLPCELQGINTIEPHHEKTCFCHMRTTNAQISLISAFFVHWQDSITPLVVIFELSRLLLVSVSEQAGLSLPWSQTTKTSFLVTRLSYKRNNGHPRLSVAGLVEILLLVL